MSNKRPVVFSLAAALASLLGVSTTDKSAVAAIEPAEGSGSNQATDAIAAGNEIEPNAFYQMGDDLMSFLVTRSADGTIVAQHRSHYSHGSHVSHESHRSHYSSRY
jgi:hypothetical protein